MQSVETIAPLITIYDLEVLPDDDNTYEIVEGELFVSRTPSLNHQTLIARFTVSLTNYLDDNPVGQFWITPGVILDEYNAVVPDLAFVEASRLTAIASGIRLIGAPDLAIEIVSPGSENARRDNVIKRQTYAKFGVQEYWVVEPTLQYIEVSRLQKGVLASVGKFRIEDEITSPLLPNFTLKVIDVFRS